MGRGEPAHDREPDNDLETSDAVERVVRCRTCGVAIANLRSRTTVQGSTHHERVNPGGYVHRFTTYASTIETRVTTPPEADFSWFDGYAWCVLACAACEAHLGWRFVPSDAEGSPFDGLRDDQVIEGPAS